MYIYTMALLCVPLKLLNDLRPRSEEVSSNYVTCLWLIIIKSLTFGFIMPQNLKHVSLCVCVCVHCLNLNFPKVAKIQVHYRYVHIPDIPEEQATQTGSPSISKLGSACICLSNYYTGMANLEHFNLAYNSLHIFKVLLHTTLLPSDAPTDYS